MLELLYTIQRRRFTINCLCTLFAGNRAKRWPRHIIQENVQLRRNTGKQRKLTARMFMYNKRRDFSFKYQRMLTTALTNNLNFASTPLIELVAWSLETSVHKLCSELARPFVFTLLPGCTTVTCTSGGSLISQTAAESLFTRGLVKRLEDSGWLY
jgi:hypothetical protein